MKLNPFVILMFLAISVCAQRQKPEMAEGLDYFEDLFNATSNDSVSCYRIPALITAPNGDILAAIDERVPSCNDLRGSDDINIVLRRSEDNGNSWSPIETVVDFPLGESASDPSLIVDRTTNEIFMFYNYMDLNTEKDIYYLHVVKSSDNGKTWSEPEDITDQITKPGWREDFKFITSGRGIQTRDGQLLHCMVNLNSGMHVFGSEDHGKSWFLIDNPIKPADESKIVELEDGRWMINARVNDKKGIRYIHISSDEGETWTTEPEPQLSDPGCNASVIRYTSKKDGYLRNRLLFANANSVDDRTDLTVRISYDEGKTWSDGKSIYAGSAAYSSLTVLKNGDIAVFFEKDGYTENMFARFTLEWLTDSEDQYRNPENGQKRGMGYP